MGNIISYLKWRGDLSFAERPFGMVDNLVLSELAYVDFSGIVPSFDGGGEITVQEAAALWEEIGNEADPLSQTEFSTMHIRLEDGYDFVDVRDVAEGIIRCAEYGEAGETYILSNEYITVKKMFEILSILRGKPQKYKAVPLKILVPSEKEGIYMNEFNPARRDSAKAESMTLLAYPLYKGITKSREKKYALQIILLSEEIMDGKEQ